MELTRWSSALDSSYNNAFFEKEEVLGKYEVVRLVVDKANDLTAAALLSGINAAVTSVEDVVDIRSQFWIFETSGPEANSSIARYYKGARNSVLLGNKLKKRVAYEGSYREDGQIWWFALYPLDTAELDQYLWALCGRSRMLLFFVENFGESIDVFCRDVFDAVRSKTPNGQTRCCIPQVLRIASGVPKLALVSGFGSEDFGGFFLDIFLPRTSAVASAAGHR